MPRITCLWAINAALVRKSTFGVYQHHDVIKLDVPEDDSEHDSWIEVKHVGCPVDGHRSFEHGACGLLDRAAWCLSLSFAIAGGFSKSRMRDFK